MFESSEAAKDDGVKSTVAADKCNEYTFHSVAELSLGTGRSSGKTVVDMERAHLEGSNTQNGEGHECLSYAGSYSIEIRDSYIPPWITCNLCTIMGSEGRDIEASFTTGLTSAGLNFALEKLANKSEEDASLTRA